MDILTHTLSGVAVATCVAAFTQTNATRKAKIILAGALGGAIPDIDAISMWSYFDATFGKLFNLPYSGRAIYGSKFWYSHHAFFHSLIGSVVVGLLLLFLLYGVKKLFKSRIAIGDFCRTHAVYFVAFVLGFWAHLLGDIPTPSSVWSGVALFWPSKGYVGGTGQIWWWNNYDIFLLIAACIFLNLAIPAVSKYIKARARTFTLSILFTTLLLITLQINTRQYSYAYTGNATNYAEMERNSKKEQERILGKKLYRFMTRFDAAVRLNF